MKRLEVTLAAQGSEACPGHTSSEGAVAGTIAGTASAPVRVIEHAVSGPRLGTPSYFRFTISLPQSVQSPEPLYERLDSSEHSPAKLFACPSNVIGAKLRAKLALSFHRISCSCAWGHLPGAGEGGRQRVPMRRAL